MSSVWFNRGQRCDTYPSLVLNLIEVILEEAYVKNVKVMFFFLG
jgi:hypothetical protein